ncbi:MAG: hypothetical protein RL385_5362, partial [Pseudomonadota bacterium]
MPGRSAGIPLKLRDGPLAVAHSVLTDAVRARLRLISVCVGGVLLAHGFSGGTLLDAHYLPAEQAFAREGLAVMQEDLPALAAQSAGTRTTRFAVRASEAGGPADVWIARGVVSPRGELAELRSLHNLTRTSSAEEGAPVLLDRWALVTRMIGADFVGFELFDLAGEAPTEQGVRERLQRGISNLQSTGAWSGIGRRSYNLRTKAQTLSVGHSAGHFVIRVDDLRIVIDPAME